MAFVAWMEFDPDPDSDRFRFGWGREHGYLYDSNRLAGVLIPNLGFVTISDYTWNRPKSMTLPGGATREVEYDPLMRVKEITSLDPGGNALLNYTYAHDNMDNITAKQTEHGDYGYGYDDLHRLATVDNPAAGLADEAFAYDSVGNRLTSAPAAGSWAYNDNNELLSSSGLSGGSTYEYDANGNTVKKTEGGAVTSYVYNTEDRLTQVWSGLPGSGSLTATYYYDPFGRRLWKEVGGTRTYYHYADEGLVAEMDASGTVVKSYGWQPGGTWGTDPLFMKSGGNYYFYHNDHLGTPQKLTASNGAVVWSAKYSSFGEAIVDPDSIVTNNLRFPGQYYDSETGLHYNCWRYYDPGVGRYLRIDPIGFGGDYENLYAYVSNDPVNWIDPFGFRRRAPGPSQPWRRPNPYNLPWDQPPGRRAPGASGTGCQNVLMEFCDEWCCDYDWCTGECRTKCPMITSPEGAKKAYKKCIKSHWEWVTICNGKVIRYK